MQILQVADPALIAEALRSKDLDKRPMNAALDYFAGPHSLPTLLTNASNERWKAVRYSLTSSWSPPSVSLPCQCHTISGDRAAECLQFAARGCFNLLGLSGDQGCDHKEVRQYQLFQTLYQWPPCRDTVSRCLSTLRVEGPPLSSPAMESHLY